MQILLIELVIYYLNCNNRKRFDENQVFICLLKMINSFKTIFYSYLIIKKVLSLFNKFQLHLDIILLKLSILTGIDFKVCCHH